MSTVARIGLLVGSVRQNGNHAGLASWVTSRFNNDTKAQATHTIEDITPSPPLGPVLDPVIAAGIKDPVDYASPPTRAFSTLVSSLAGLVILTPQYNWGYPGELKNLLDHLYYEWRGKPVALVSYGGHGGGKAAAQLREVLEGGFKMRVVAAVQVTLPEEYIRSSDKRVKGSEDEFLQAYDGALASAFKTLTEELPAKNA